MNLFIVESPLQLLCAFEAISLSNEPYKLLIRQTGRGSNDLHLLNCVKKLNLHYKIFRLEHDNAKFDFLKNLILWISLYTKKFNVIYLGSFYSSALKLIKFFLRGESFLYLDDGAATLRAQAEIQNKISPKVNWFTFFEIDPVPDQKIYKHSFMNLQKKFPKNSKSGQYFIGQPVEIMMGFEKEDYIRAVSSIAHNISDGEMLKYIPHRVENLEHIVDIPNVEILHLDIPIELYFLSCEECSPSKIYSCYSTALISLKSIFTDIEVFSIRNAKSKENNVELEHVYQYLENNKITIIRL